MERAIAKDPQIIYASDVLERRSMLHIAAASPIPAAVSSIPWLLERGVPWNALDMERRLAEDLARMCKNEESCKILREFAVNKGKIVHVGSYIYI